MLVDIDRFVAHTVQQYRRAIENSSMCRCNANGSHCICTTALLRYIRTPNLGIRGPGSFDVGENNSRTTLEMFKCIEPPLADNRPNILDAMLNPAIVVVHEPRRSRSFSIPCDAKIDFKAFILLHTYPKYPRRFDMGGRFNPLKPSISS